MGVQEAFAAEQAAIAAYTQSQKGRGAKYVMGINVAPYAGARTPGIDATRMFSDPCCMLKDADRRRASGDLYIWKRPDDTYTQNMVDRGILRPVLDEEIDPQSPYANVQRKKIITKLGVRQVIRTPGGLGLFVCPNPEALNAADQSLVPGGAQARPNEANHWEREYLSNLAEQNDRFAGDMETLSNQSLQGRVNGKLEAKDTAKEMIA